VVSFTPLQLYPRTKSPGTYWIGVRVNPRADLDDMENLTRGRHRINAHRTHTNIHASSGIRTHDLSVGAGEDSSCLRPRGHCDQCLDELEKLKVFTLPALKLQTLSHPASSQSLYRLRYSDSCLVGQQAKENP
jgi:hypothetical protein